MKTLNLKQGTKEWHEHRANHFNASDAPAMMGASPYKTRTELLAEKATGITPDIDVNTQRIFNDGHKYEALTRCVVETKYNIDLFPVTGIVGRYSASFDGLTMDETIQWEHKSMNDEIRAVNDISELSDHLKIQMEHQLMLSGAEKCIFTASKWDADGNNTEIKHLEYLPDIELRKKIVAGWGQFDKDLKAYKPKEISEAPQAEAVKSLPALVIQVEGKVVASNLAKFETEATEFISSINESLTTDEEFANAKATVKYLSQVEKDIESALNSAISQMETVDDMKRSVELVRVQCRTKRLKLDKLVKSEEANIKSRIVDDANVEASNHKKSLESETVPIILNLNSVDFAGAMKNKKTLKSLHDAVDTELAKFKIEADAVAKDIRQKLAWLRSEADDYKFLFADLQQVIYKPLDDFKLLVESRINEHKQAEKLKEEEVKQAEEIITNDVKDKPLGKPHEKQNDRPTKEAMVEVLADHYGVSIGQIMDWLYTP